MSQGSHNRGRAAADEGEAAPGRLGPGRVGLILGLSLATIGVGLGSAAKLSYHEAIWAQTVRETVATGGLIVPTVAGRPWLEKPPLHVWMIAAIGTIGGKIDETAARIPSAVAGIVLIFAIATLSARRLGPNVGLLAGLIQATTSWTVLRGRLAEPDISLAALVALAFNAFDLVRTPRSTDRRRPARLAFFVCVGLTFLVKGIGFGAILIFAAVAVVLVWDRDRTTAMALLSVKGWLILAVIGGTWPILVLMRHPKVFWWWFLHVSDRFAARPEHFAGEAGWAFAIAPLGLVLPWTPCAVLGAGRSSARAVGDRGGFDRLLIAWFAAPIGLIALATVKNGHYLIHAMPPCSVWAATSLVRLAERLSASGWTVAELRRRATALFLILGAAYAGGYGVFAPWLDFRGREWSFYATVGHLVPDDEPLAILYDWDRPDPWDRQPYDSPFGPLPHDLPARLFYLGRAASWRVGAGDLAERPLRPHSRPFSVIARDRDLAALATIGRPTVLARGPSSSFDRAFVLVRIEPFPAAIRERGRLTSVR